MGIDRQQLIQRVQEIKGLSDDERAGLLQLLREQKKYGIVWEDKPEEAEQRLADELPVLTEVKERYIAGATSDAPNHILIEGDNLHALTALSYTHEGKIDVIYIDPPYNTGNKDFVYNDSYVDREDGYRHSKWLSFMNKRLQIAKRLLSDRGVIFISIDDNEQAPLKLLCDEVFGEENFIANMIWRGGKRNAAKWISTSHEYMLLYTKSLTYCNEHGITWKEKKKGLQPIYDYSESLMKQCNGNYEWATSKMKKWFKSLPDGDSSKDNEHYCNIDEKGVYFASDISRGGGGGPTWQITNPNTGEIVSTPARGWAYSKIEDLYQDIENGMIHFNGNGVPCKKRYLRDFETQLVETVFYRDRRGSSKRLRSLLGADLFPFPKDEFILKEKFCAFGSKDSTILDFFAGSGTTLHATMQLNAEDGGRRQCILVTNNENGICENVTYERNRRVIQGYTTPKGVDVAGLADNTLRYYRTDFVPNDTTIRNKRRLMELSTDMLCIKNNLYSEQEEFAGRKLNKKKMRYFTEQTQSSGNKSMLVVYDEQVVDTLVDVLAEMDVKQKIMIYVFSNTSYPHTDNFEEVLSKVELCALPSAILNAYRKITGR